MDQARDVYDVTGQSTKNTKIKVWLKVWLQMLGLGVKRQSHHVTQQRKSACTEGGEAFSLCMRELEALAIAIEL